MLKVGKKRLSHLSFVAGDGLNLPFADNSFDAVTISFGLRNLHNTERGLQELLRVSKPGGKLVICEFSQPTFSLSRKTSSNPAAYEYLAESIANWPAQLPLAEVIVKSGWSEVTWRNLTGGIVAVHSAIKS
jgi:demethylmenaquinone methyltransferase/2-methoxy-6-polyprenyl-1,4-benzoquinol methylase